MWRSVSAVQSFSIVKKNIGNIGNISKQIRFNSNKIYLDTEEWIIKDNNNIKLGLSKKAIELMNEIVYIDVDGIVIDDTYEKGDEICDIESVKAAESLYSPDNCKVIEINETLIENLDELNNNPENEDNWIIKLEKL
jgi:glycine cleavage system H protein